MPTLDEIIEAADAAASGKPQREVASSGRYIGNAALAGAGDTIGGVADTPARLYQLAKAQAGVGPIPGILSAITGRDKSEFMPEVNIHAANYFSDKLKGLLGVDERLVAPDAMTRYAGSAARAGTGAVLSGPTSVVPALKALAVGGAAGLGAEGGGDIAEGLGAPRVVGQLVGGLGAGVGAASAGGMVGAATRVPTMLDKMQATARSPEAVAQAEKAATNIVNARMRAAMEGTPNAAANIDDALALRARIPGFQPSVAEMANAPAALDMQRVYARGSPKGLNEEVARVAASDQALKDHFNRIAPAAGQAGDVRSAVNQKLSNQLGRLDAEAQSTAAQLPTADLVKMGNRAAELAQAEKAAAQPGITAAYEKAYSLAPESVIDAKPILAKIEEALGQPISQLKPETAPRTFDAIKRFVGGEGKSPEELSYLSSVLGGEVKNEGARATMTLKEAAALRQAMNADARAASTSRDQLAATRARNIGEVRGVVDEAIAGSPIAQEAKDAFKAANTKYATEYAPRFKEGTNLQMFQATSANEPRIIADKFIDSYFKTDQMGGGTKAANFAQLFGKNNEARELTKEGILDRFRNHVVNAETGAIDPRKAADFQRQYGRTLESFKANGVNAADDIKRFTEIAAKQAQAAEKVQSLANRLKYESTDKMVDAALGSREVMGNIKFRLNEAERDTFTRKLMEKAMGANSGQPITGDKINSFLDKNQSTLKMLLKPEHEEALRDIAKGMTMIERSPVHGLSQGAGTDPLKAATGVSMATVWSQWRATTGGRQGVATAGFNLAAPVFTRLSQTRFDDVMKTALHDPKTAEALSAFLKSNTQAAATNWAGRMMDAAKTAGSMLWQSKGAIGEMALGASNYPANFQRTIPALNAVVERQ